MKVLQINSVCGIGSTGRIATDLYNMIESQGHECIIAYGRGNAPKGFKTIKIGSRLNNYIHVAKTRLFDKHGFSSKKATRDFLKKVTKYDPDVIHLHNIHGYYINIEMLFQYLSECKKKVIWTLHDCWAFTGHCAYFDYVQCNRWMTGCYECPQINEYPKSVLIDNSQENYNAKKEIFSSVQDLTIVTPSLWLEMLAKESYLCRYPTRVINNGISLDIFKPVVSDFKKQYGMIDKFMILGVANIWEKRKGLEYFYKLSEIVSEDSFIVLVGVNEEQKKGLPENIIGITRTSNVNELVQIYSAADVFVNPTLEDNFPTTNIESLACGTPVITFDTGGSGESVDNDVGIIVKTKNVDDLLDAVVQIKGNGKDFYFKNCIAKSKDYDAQVQYSLYLQIYKDIL